MTRTTLNHFAISLATLVAASGCTPNIQVVDDLDFRFDLRRAGPDRLETPYVEGTAVELRLTAWRDMSRFEARSSNPDVFDCIESRVDDSAIILECFATGPGEAMIELSRRDRDRVFEAVPIRVGRPDRVELHAAGAVFAMLGEQSSRVEDPVMLEDGLATFEVRWFDGGERLFGNAVLDVASEGVSAWPESTFMFENRDWLKIQALEPTDAALIELRHLGRPLALHQIDVVPAEQITELIIAGESEVGAQPGDTITLLGRVFDERGRSVFGAEYDWFRNSLREWGSGDMYRYGFDPEQAVELEANFDGLTDQVDIRGFGTVRSSNDVGCSTTGALGLSGWLLGVGLLIRRRR